MWLEEGETEDRTVWWTQCIRSQDVAAGKGDRGLYDGCNVSGARMGLEVGATVWWRQCKRSQDVAGGRNNRG